MASKVQEVHVRNGQAIKLGTNSHHYLTCCDCGLVHKIRITSWGGQPITIRFWRAVTQTMLERRKRRKGQR